jgi:GT2 family glycosyltransferase
MKISIVMAYRNRRVLLSRTLHTIARSAQKDIEIIIVDDGSRSDQRIEDLPQFFPCVRVVRVEEKDKWYTNPCAAYNLGISEAKGDIVVLQNPECLHVGDVLTNVVNSIQKDNYISISAYALDKRRTEELGVERYLMPGFPEYFKLYPQQAFNKLGWYNHPYFRPVGYHFCAAILKSNLDKLGGFDERYAVGFAYDDDELVCRVKRLGLAVVIPTEVSVIHQYHDKERPKNFMYLLEKNRQLFEITKTESIIKVINRYEKN